MTGDLDAERAVLGALLIEQNAILDVAGKLSADDFANAGHARIFGAMLKLHQRSEPIDELTLRAELGANAETAAYVAALTEAVPTAANIGYYANLVRKEARRRDCMRAMSEAMTACARPGVDGDAVIAKLVTELGNLAAGRDLLRAIPMRDLVRDEVKAVEQRATRKEPTGLRTGFAALDGIMGGLQPGGLVVIAARPSMGKSALAAEILANVAARGDGAGLLFSLEMTRQEQAQRRIASESGVHLGRLRSGMLSESDFPKLANGANRIFTSRDDIHIADKADLSIAELRAYARSFASRHRVACIAVDYMQLVLGDGETREQEVSSISRGLKALAMELRVPVIALSQLNRGVEQRAEKKPQLSDLRESGAIEQDAHQVLLIYRDDYYNPETTKEPGIAQIGIAKNRNGPTGMIKLRWRGECTRFEPLGANEAAA